MCIGIVYRHVWTHAYQFYQFHFTKPNIPCRKPSPARECVHVNMHVCMYAHVRLHVCVRMCTYLYANAQQTRGTQPKPKPSTREPRCGRDPGPPLPARPPRRHGLVRLRVAAVGLRGRRRTGIPSWLAPGCLFCGKRANSGRTTLPNKPELMTQPDEDRRRTSCSPPGHKSGSTPPIEHMPREHLGELQGAGVLLIWWWVTLWTSP